MKILAVAPRYRPGRGPSNALYFLKYINGIKFLYYSNDILLEDKTLNVKLLKSPDRNHYVLSRVVRRLVEKVKPDYIISIAPELMLHLEEKDLERSVIIPQGFIEFAHIKHKPTAIRALPVYLEVIYVSKKVKGYAAISTYMYRRISTFLKPKKIELTYNPVREMFFELGHERMQKEITVSNDKLKLLYVGGLLSLKGVDKLIMWFPSILREFREAELHIVGDGPLRERLLYLIYKLNLRNNVFIHGRVNDDDLLKCIGVLHY